MMLFEKKVVARPQKDRIKMIIDLHRHAFGIRSRQPTTYDYAIPLEISLRW